MSRGATKLKALIASEYRSQTEFARLLGISQPRICMILNHQRAPSLLLAAKIEVATKGTIRCVDWVDLEVESQNPASDRDNLDIPCSSSSF